MIHIIMVNPISGRKNGYKHAIVVQKLLKKYNIDSKIISSNYSGELRKISYEISHNQNARFYCIGGDGTLNEIVSGIIEQIQKLLFFHAELVTILQNI